MRAQSTFNLEQMGRERSGAVTRVETRLREDICAIWRKRRDRGAGGRGGEGGGLGPWGGGGTWKYCDKPPMSCLEPEHVLLEGTAPAFSSSGQFGARVSFAKKSTRNQRWCCCVRLSERIPLKYLQRHIQHL